MERAELTVPSGLPRHCRDEMASCIEVCSRGDNGLPGLPDILGQQGTSPDMGCDPANGNCLCGHESGEVCDLVYPHGECADVEWEPCGNVPVYTEREG